jgi:nitrogen fixation NifU-like protein
VGGLDDLYQELILDHYRRKRGEGSLDHPSVAVDQHNPLCGDEVHLELGIEDGVVAEVAHTGQGCSISQASVSMMTEALRGRTLDDALGTVNHFRLVMHGDEAADEDRLGDAIALEGVAKYPVRVKCALLGWMAAKDAIQTYQGDGGNGDGRGEEA